jgi:P-type E1-E2 ATPase
MPLTLDIPGRERLELHYLLLDVNGTLSERGQLIDGVAERLDALRDQLEPQLLSADTFGTLNAIARQLSVPARIAPTADEKRTILHELGARRCVAVGNGANDARMLAEAALGIAVLGREGASSAALAACDLVCPSILEALELLHEPKTLAATLRS